MPSTGPRDTRVRLEVRSVLRCRVRRARTVHGRTTVACAPRRARRGRRGSEEVARLVVRRPCSAALIAPSIRGRRTGSPTPAAASAAPARCPARPRHLPEHRPQHRRRHREHGGTTQHVCHRRGDLTVRQRFGRRQVERSRQPLGVQEMPQRRHLVVQRDVRPVLPPVPEPPAQTGPEQREQPPHAPPRAPPRAPSARTPSARPPPGPEPPRPPTSRRPRQEPLARRRALVHRAVAGLAVVADRAAVEEHPRPVVLGQSGDRLGERGRARTRLVRISSLYASVQRRSPTPAPARFTTASHPASPAASTVPRSGSQRISSADRGSRRTSRSTVCPSAVSDRTRAEPISPDAPATAIRACSMASILPRPWKKSR